MQTFLITANDTDVGKTYVTGILAQHFAALGKVVQIVKAIDCGGSNDAENAAQAAGSTKNLSAHTLLSFPQPLAPVAAVRINRYGDATCGFYDTNLAVG